MRGYGNLKRSRGRLRGKTAKLRYLFKRPTTYGQILKLPRQQLHSVWQKLMNYLARFRKKLRKYNHSVTSHKNIFQKSKETKGNRNNCETIYKKILILQRRNVQRLKK